MLHPALENCGIGVFGACSLLVYSAPLYPLSPLG